jgi:VanZ family protein
MLLRILRWVLFLGWVALAPFLLLRRVEALPSVPWLFHFELPRVDLLGHAGLFWVGARLAVAALLDGARTARQVRAVAGSVALYSGVLEALQYFVPGRAVEASDLGANLLGALVVATAIPLLGARTDTSSNSPFWARA